jgi:hypothetical protein
MRLLIELNNLGVSGDEDMRLMQRWNQPDLPHHTKRSLEQLRKDIATVRAINIAIEARDTNGLVQNEKLWDALWQIGVGREELKVLKKRWAGLGLGQRAAVDKEQKKERKNKELRAKTILNLAYQLLG